jgi:uncharacterized RDD family membrane protein YckC
LSSSAFPAAWLPAPRDPDDDDLPEPPASTPPYGTLTLPAPAAVDESPGEDLPAPALDESPDEVDVPSEVVPSDDAVVATTDGPQELPETPLVPFAQVVETYVGWGTRLCAFGIDVGALILPFAAGVMLDSALMAYAVPMLGGQLTVIPLVLAAIVWNRGVWQGRTGQSLGKKAMGLRLVREATYGPVGITTALLRELAHVVDTLSVVGWLNPLWSGKKQTFADKMVRAVVVG